MNEQIIVALTSWRKRITNLPTILDTIWAQTMPPDKVVLTLASEEFPKHVLPAEVQAYIDSHDRLQVCWVKHDTRVWKKFLFAAKLYPDALIVPIDDDMLYPQGMIEDLFKTHQLHPDAPISGNHYTFRGQKCHCGCASMVQAKHFDGWERYYRHRYRIEMPSSDIFYTMLAATNGYFYVPSEVDYQATAVNYNETEPYSRTGVKNKIRKTHDFCCRLFGQKVLRLFGEDDHRPFCVLGSAQTELGKAIEQELLAWLTPHFNVYLVQHDGRTFEYAALRFLQEVMSRTDAPCFYVHTKGAYNVRKVAHRVRNMWRSEFVGRQAEYLQAVDGERPVMACPYTGETHVPWYNGWVANAAAIRLMPIIQTEDRFYYEHHLFEQAEAVGLRMNDVVLENRKPMHDDLKLNFD